MQKILQSNFQSDLKKNKVMCSAHQVRIEKFQKRWFKKGDPGSERLIFSQLCIEFTEISNGESIILESDSTYKTIH